ncbi:hypothetical protein K0M31_002564 [Melipona bicolor]|uniref:Uncharacterized protein n=1 Tax=Melipona bicolor TaxID=60889 RepID=A0AA40KZ92_9HYME|nr:hypothetical protein K0M31_002564 [Melipona bicolor]
MELDFCRVEVVSAQAYCQRGFAARTQNRETHLHRESREVGGPREGWKSVFCEVTTRLYRIADESNLSNHAVFSRRREGVKE